MANLFLQFGISIFLVIMTYFFDLTAGLILNLLFILIQGTLMLYLNIIQGKTVSLALAFWLFMPILLSVTFYGMTYQQQQLQAENQKLHNDMVQLGAFDEETNLRTMVSYIEDASVFIETSRRYELPVTMLVLRIRYFDEMRRILTSDQLREVIQMVSKTIKASTRGNDIVYILDRENPSWGVLLYTDLPGAQIVAARIKDNFAKQVSNSVTLSGTEVLLIAGIAAYDQKTMSTAYELMNAAAKETEYDV
ncbi:GGDEF domain-containing protein [Loigolactobacillus jiayinensis]|uniref:GGDEF domain-containing protein n=1 Tax=Loigolactobacillus jiayinensis TaxID=2486016 RepID=A0ABW1REF1_9LACO